MEIPQFRSDLPKSDYKAIERAFENRYIAEGPIGQEFNSKLLDIIGSEYGVLASNGTLAIYLALKALEIGPGDEVIVQNTTFIATANAVEMVGAKPIFVDTVSPTDPSLDLAKVLISKDTKAIMIAHLYGTACSNIEEIRDFCIDNNLYLLEDAAQALGVANENTHCGNFGDVGTFSFFADKTITTGEGGFVVTNNENVNSKLRYLRNQGRLSSGTFVHPEIGFNFRLTDIQSALGLAQLSRLDTIIKKKNRIHDLYKSHLGDKVDFLSIRNDFSFIPFRTVVFVDEAHSVMKKMSEHGIESRTVFYPLHKQPCFEKYKYDDESFPNSIECYRTGICLPTWIGLTDQMIEYVSTKLLLALDGR